MAQFVAMTYGSRDERILINFDLVTRITATSAGAAVLHFGSGDDERRQDVNVAFDTMVEMVKAKLSF
ncbi:MAG: hypothetical protein AAFY22_05920 [Pseudomonadota bacterium]